MRDRLPHIRSLIRHVVGAAEELDDMAQVAMMTVLHGIPTYRGEGDFTAWIDKVVVRSAIAYAKQRRLRFQRTSDAPSELLVDPSMDSRPDAALERLRIRMLLEQLPKEQRQAIVMHHMMQLTIPEIAEELDIPLETVRTRVRTAIVKLRALLGSKS